MLIVKDLQFKQKNLPFHTITFQNDYIVLEGKNYQKRIALSEEALSKIKSIYENLGVVTYSQVLEVLPKDE